MPSSTRQASHASGLHPDSTRVVRVGTLVIGGGQAGLAVAQQLGVRDVDHLVLDAESRVGDVWRRRWDSLRLFTPACFSGLPDMVFPAPPDHLPHKDEVADYLARYAERFDIPIRPDTRVRSLTWDGVRHVAHADGMRFEADQVVVATGPFQRPRIPAIAERIMPSVLQVHSSEYVNPFSLPEGPVLVVGAGPSGAQIAMELARFRKVWLAGRDTGHLPRRFLGRDIFEWIWPVMRRATADTRLGRRLRARAMQGGDALIGIPERSIAASGVVRVGRLDDVRGGLPVCGGEVVQPRVIVWCTGFRQDLGWINQPILDAQGRLRHQRGVAADAAGLYFVGMRFQHRLTSSLIGGVGADARFIAGEIARRAHAGSHAVAGNL
jgi:putative flavoprotein involved in K+ transport